MSDLISRNDLNKIIDSYDDGTINIYELLEQIRNIPTDFYVDKVVEQLKANGICSGNIGFILLNKAISIVKGGGRDE